MHKLGKTEFWVAVAGLVASVATATSELGILAPWPTAAAVVAIVGVAATYIAGRSYVKGKEADRDAAMAEANTIRTRVPRPHGP